MLPFDPRALAVVERLRRAGFDAALVGGCVRDSLLGLPPHDYDAATAARPEEIRALFAGCPQYDAGSRFGTVAVELDGLWVEVTTFRREEGYADHRRPDRVAFSPRLEDDLARRDFTINAMAWGPAGLVDRFGGRADLERGLIRCVGDPDRRFAEDLPDGLSAHSGDGNGGQAGQHVFGDVPQPVGKKKGDLRGHAQPAELLFGGLQRAFPQVGGKGFGQPAGAEPFRRKLAVVGADVQQDAALGHQGEHRLQAIVQ